MNPKNLSRLLSALSSDSGDEDDSVKSVSSRPANPQILQSACAVFLVREKFKPGDLVRWKRLDGGGTLCNKKRPGLDEVAVVMEALDVPLFDQEARSSGSAYFREPLDLRLGLMDSDGDLDEFHFDSRRFEHATDDDDSEELRELAQRLQEPPKTLKPGMLVTWKPGLKNKKKPDYGEPVVVIEVLDSPVFDEDKAGGSAYFREPLDMVCGENDDDGDFILFHYDSRRFMPYTNKPKRRRS